MDDNIMDWEDCGCELEVPYEEVKSFSSKYLAVPRDALVNVLKGNEGELINDKEHQPQKDLLDVTKSLSVGNRSEEEDDEIQVIGEIIYEDKIVNDEEEDEDIVYENVSEEDDEDTFYENVSEEEEEDTVYENVSEEEQDYEGIVYENVSEEEDEYEGIVYENVSEEEDEEEISDEIANENQDEDGKEEEGMEAIENVAEDEDNEVVYVNEEENEVVYVNEEENEVVYANEDENEVVCDNKKGDENIDAEVEDGCEILAIEMMEDEICADVNEDDGIEDEKVFEIEYIIMEQDDETCLGKSETETTGEEDDDVIFIKECNPVFDNKVDVAEVEVAADFSSPYLPPYGKKLYLAKSCEQQLNDIDDEGKTKYTDCISRSSSIEVKEGIKGQLDSSNVDGTIDSRAGEFQRQYLQSEYSCEDEDQVRGYNFNCTVPKNFLSTNRYNYVGSRGEDSDLDCEDQLSTTPNYDQGLSEYQIMRHQHHKFHQKKDRQNLKEEHCNPQFSSDEIGAVKVLRLGLSNQSTFSTSVDSRKRNCSSPVPPVNCSFVKSLPIKKPEALFRNSNIRKQVKIYRHWLSTLGEDWDDICAKRAQICRELKRRLMFLKEMTNISAEKISQLNSLLTADDDDKSDSEEESLVATWVISDSDENNDQPKVIEYHSIQEPVKEENVNEEQDVGENHPIPVSPNLKMHQKVYPKPSFSYSCLIFLALKNSSSRCLPVSDIYKFICYHFPYFKNASKAWKGAVRHTMCNRKTFEKVAIPGGSRRKGSSWRLLPEHICKMDKEVLKYSQNHCITNRLAMSDPDNLELIIRGELIINFTREPEQDGTPNFSADPTRSPTPTSQGSESSPNRFSDLLREKLVSITLAPDNSNAVTPISIDELQPVVTCLVEVERENEDTFDPGFPVITKVQGSYNSQNNMQ